MQIDGSLTPFGRLLKFAAKWIIIVIIAATAYYVVWKDGERHGIRKIQRLEKRLDN